jgi:hypothetical protein
MNPRTAILISIILAAALFRLFHLVPNVSPIAAMALFAGAQFADRRMALLVPLAAMALSDLVLGLHGTLPFVYAAFALTVLMGGMLRDRVRALPVLGTAVAASLLFFGLTNLGVWLTWDLYPLTLEGLMQAYAAGLPFYRNTLAGDLLFTGALFGGFALAQQRWPMLRARAS